MTPFWSDDHLTLYGGDCREVLASMPAESVHCVVTSPPYWGLRDYGVADQLGLEPTPEEYVANMVAVFREVRRVLRDDGTLWLNLGDSYVTSPPGRGPQPGVSGLAGINSAKYQATLAEGHNKHRGTLGAIADGLKPKDLVGIPWRVAFALQADGWYLRSDIIWAKPNPMPESVTDRPTKAHEYLFLLSKSPRYYFDADAVREADSGQDHRRTVDLPQPSLEPSGGLAGPHTGLRTIEGRNGSGRNLRTVWTIATEPYPGAHFATFPRKLVEPCVKAGTSERGVCPECGAPWERVVERVYYGSKAGDGDPMVEGFQRNKMGGQKEWDAYQPPVTTGWRPSCAHTAEPVPASVLDPFAGSGTTLLVAQSLGRKGVGIDLNPDYLRQALARNAQTPLGLVG